MAELKKIQLDDEVVAALNARAKSRGVSLEEEVRATLSAAVTARRDAFARRGAVRAEARQRPGHPALDSARIVRRARDAWA